MSKQNNLKDYLTDLYAGIVAKKPGASRNPQNFRSEIEAIETEVATFDGTILIDTGLTTISGSYIIDQQKAYNALSALTKTKTYSVAFGAGGPPNGGDEMNFTSMTFDATNGYIIYGNITAFVSYDYMNGGDGFKDYTAHGGTGNGARINFADGTEVRKEFKELFLSIADEYVEETKYELAIERNGIIYYWDVDSPSELWLLLNGKYDTTNTYYINCPYASSYVSLASAETIVGGVKNAGTQLYGDNAYSVAEIYYVAAQNQGDSN